jgi:anti-sigma factor RsiW
MRQFWTGRSLELPVVATPWTLSSIERSQSVGDRENSAHVRYQVFLSSTFLDLQQERLETTQGLLRTGRFIPAGMELFGAAALPPWEYITRVLDVTDYFVLVFGSRYGSSPPDGGASYTEREYDYAVENKIPVLAFVPSKERRLLEEHIETDHARREALREFRNKVEQRHLVTKWSNPTELAQKVTSALWRATDDIQRPGWVRRSIEQDETPVAGPPASGRRAPHQDHIASAEAGIASVARVLEVERSHWHPRWSSGLILVAEPLDEEIGHDVATKLGVASLRSILAASSFIGASAERLKPWSTRLGARDISQVDHVTNHPDGVALASGPYRGGSVRPEDSSADYGFCQVVVTDNGGVRVYCEPLGWRIGTNAEPPGIDLDVPVVLTRQLIRLLDILSGSYTSYRAEWGLGVCTVNASNLPALISADGLPTNERLKGEYEQHVQASHASLVAQPGGVTERLLRRLLRQFGTLESYVAVLADGQ